MNWRDQLYQDESGRYKFLTTVNITNADLDEEYCRFGFIHEAVNGFAGMRCEECFTPLESDDLSERLCRNCREEESEPKPEQPLVPRESR